MEEEISLYDLELWERLVVTRSKVKAAPEDYEQAKRAFFAPGVDRIALLNRALSLPNWPTASERTAFELAKAVRSDELAAVLPGLVRQAIFKEANMFMAQELIKAIPRAFVLANIESAAEPYLEQMDERDCGALQLFYHRLDRDLALRFARRLAESTNPELQIAGKEYLEEVGG